MRKSIITIAFKSDWDNDGVEERIKYFDSTEEMLIPKIIGEVKEGFTKLRRLDRILPTGHRYHGYI